MLKRAWCAARGRRARVALLPLIGMLLVLLHARPAHAQDPTAGFEQGVFEIVAEQLPPLTLLVLVDSAGSILLPTRAVAEYLGYELQRSAGEWRLPRLHGAGVVQLETRSLVLGEDTVHLTPAELVITEAELYLRTERLAQLLEATANVDFARLSVVLARDPPFPAQQRIELEQRRTVMRGRERGADSARASRFATTLHSGFGTLDWDISTNGLDPSRLTFLRAQLGGSVLGGGLTLGGTLEAGRDAQETLRDRSLRYHRVFARPWLAQAEAGDIITHGLYARFITGFELTNAPFMHEYDLGEIVLRPELPPGWQYEVLQGQQLLGYSGPGAVAPVAVPLRTGATPVEVRMYGPAGEEIVEQLVYQTPVTLLPHGRLQYVAGAGTCEDNSCDAYAHADVRWGGWSRLTIGGGAEFLEDGRERTLRPYGVASFTTGTMLIGELQAMPGASYRTNLLAFLSEGTSARFNAGLARAGYRGAAAIDAPGHRWDFDANLERQLGGGLLGIRTVRLNLGGAGQRGEGPQRWRIGSTAAHPLGYTELRLDRAADALDLLTVRNSHLAPLTLAGRTLRPTLNGAIASSRRGVELVEAGIMVQPLPLAAIATSIQWSREGGFGFSFAWNSRMGPLQAVFRTAKSEGADPTSAVSLGGSLAFAPTGIHAEPISRTGYAGAFGTVFLDADGDGLPGPDEPRVDALPLQIGSQLVTTDSAGRFAAWGLFPWVRTGVVVDSLRISDPSWTLARPRLEVVPAPNAAARIDVPLVQTRELAGSLVRGPGIPTVAGITLVITNLESGQVTTTLTFSDGTFYVSRLRPGRYQLTVAPAALAALSAAEPQPVAFTIEGQSTEPLLELPPLRLQGR